MTPISFLVQVTTAAPFTSDINDLYAFGGR